jgi:hypothetical protein
MVKKTEGETFNEGKEKGHLKWNNYTGSINSKTAMKRQTFRKFPNSHVFQLPSKRNNLLV